MACTPARSRLALSVLFVCVALAGCSITNTREIEGSGVLVTKEFDVQGFRKVGLSQAFKAKIVQDDAYGVAVTVDDNLVPYLKVTLEGDTPMEQWVESGTMPEADSDLAADMYQMAQDCMREHGYRHYEISNWAKPGYESRHNLTYWRNQPYIGVGPGAHSYLPSHRFFNIKSPREYVRKLREAPALADLGNIYSEHSPQSIEKMPGVEEMEIIDEKLEVAETLMLGLRLDTGISEAVFTDRFNAFHIKPNSLTVQAPQDLLRAPTPHCSLLTQKSRKGVIGKREKIGEEMELAPRRCHTQFTTADDPHTVHLSGIDRFGKAGNRVVISE